MILEKEALEKGTFVVTASFEDENGNAVTPLTMTWTLTDKLGAVKNSRQDVAIGSLSSSVDVFLSGDDLAVTVGEDAEPEVYVERRLLFEGTYTSTDGTKNLVDEVKFFIRKLVGV